MKKLFLAFVLLLYTASAFAIVDLSGLYNSGYGTQFYPLLKEDSIHFGKIRMQRQHAFVNLFPGFAAVKTEYWMYNTSRETISMNIGYPIHGSYNQPEIEKITFGDLHKLNVIVNGKKVTIANLNDTSTYKHNNELYQPVDKLKARSWYFWQTTFPPRTFTKIVVYHLSLNNDAHLKKGYSGVTENAFSYLFQTGKAWGAKIDSGVIYINFNRGLTTKDVMGMLPANKLKGDNTHLAFTFKKFTPTSNNNLVLWYKAEKETEFDFGKELLNAKEHYGNLDKFPVNSFKNNSFAIINKNDFTVPDKAERMRYAVLIGTGLLGFAILAASIFLVAILLKGTKQESSQTL